MTTRIRLIALGLIKPHVTTETDRDASKQRAIAARKAALNGSINISVKRPMRAGA